MSDNTHIEFGIIIRCHVPVTERHERETVVCEVVFKKSRMFAFVSHCRISHTANSPSSFPRDALATTESGKVFTRKKSYKNTKI